MTSLYKFKLNFFSNKNYNFKLGLDDAFELLIIGIELYTTGYHEE